MLKNLDNWEEYEGFSCGSGSREKIWLTKDNEIGLFKYPKNENTTEHISEKLAYDICNLLDVSCAKVDIAEYSCIKGSISYLINREDEILIEGINYINKKYPNFTSKSSKDETLNEYYSLEMILNSIEGLGLEKNVMEMLIIDFIIGNSDRHQCNWAIIENNKNPNNNKFCPLYDNGSSLCCYVKEDSIKHFFSDKNRFNALVDTKSRTVIRIDKSNKRNPTHKEFLKYILNNYKYYVTSIINNAIKRLSEDNLDYILSKQEYNIISPNRKLLIKKFIQAKIIILCDIY